MVLVDSHCHIHLPEFNPDRRAVLDRAKATGVEKLVLVGNDHSSNQDLIRLLPEYSDQKITLGIHPHHIEEWTEETHTWIKDHLGLRQVAAIGETGLDYFRNQHSPIDQEKVMRAQIELALAHDLPVVFHIRDAFPNARRIISEYVQLRFVMHCFTGTKEDVEWISALGGYISLSGIVTFANAQELRQAAVIIPYDHLLLETDSPFLAPGKYRGQRAEPAFIVETYQIVAKLLNIPLDQLAARIEQNAKTVFGFSDFSKP